VGAKRGASIWDRLIGPVLLCDLLRLTRRGSTTIFLARGFYLGMMLLVILIFCGIELGLKTPAHFFDAFRAGFPVEANKAASFASHFFFVLLGTQLAMVVLLTPAYVGGAIAEDRERRIMDYLLVSDLSNREIVLGKYLSRLAHLALLLLTGAPLLVVAQVVGGVHFIFVVTGLAVALLTMFSVGALSILVSILNRPPSKAIFHTYVLFTPYLLYSTTFILFDYFPANQDLMQRGLELFSAGNPLMPMLRLWLGMGDADWPGGVVAPALADCSVVHGVVTVGCLGLAIRYLRRRLTATAASREERFAQRLQLCRSQVTLETARRLAAWTRPAPNPPIFRPPVSDHPILWNELHLRAPFIRFSREASTILEAIVRILTIIWGAMFFLALLINCILGGPNEEFWPAIFGISVILVGFLLIGVAVRAAGCLSEERERRTLDDLLATTFENAAIINGKWLASLLRMRLYGIMLAIVWGTSSLLGVLDWQVLPVLLVAAASWACIAASLGVFCSLLCRDTWRATVLTLGILLPLSAFPLLLGWGELAPVGGLLVLIMPSRSDTLGPWDGFSWEITTVLSGVLVYSVLAVILWSGTHFLFPRVTGRMPVGRISRRESRVGDDRR